MKAPVAVNGRTAGATVTNLRLHGGHSHAHSHGSIEKHIHGRYLRQCKIATLAGGATNIFFCATKLWFGAAGGSVALVADGFHSLTDILADIISYAAITLSRKKLPRCRYPFGIGRLETSGAIIVAAILFFGGVALLVQSLGQCIADVGTFLLSVAPTGGVAVALLLGVQRTMETAYGRVSSFFTSAAPVEEEEHTHGANATLHHSHGGSDHHGHSHFEVTQYDEESGRQVILWTMVGIAATSVICKEILFRWTRRVGLRAGSRVVVANAYHHRADAWSGGVALVGVAGQMMGLPGVDGVAGLAVSLSICKIGYGLFRDAVLEFFDFQNADEVSLIREQLQDFNLRIIGGVNVVPGQSALKRSAAAALGAAGDSPAAASSEEDDAVHQRRIRFINVFLVRHGHQYALHVTLLVYESLPAQRIQEATDLITALARESLPVKDTFINLLLCSDHTEPLEVYLRNHAITGEKAAAEVCPSGSDGRSASVTGDAPAEGHHEHPHITDNACDHSDAPRTVATGSIVNPSLERCVLALQEYHTFTADIRYDWEQRIILLPSSESCECERDVSSLAAMFKCKIVSSAPPADGAVKGMLRATDGGHGHSHSPLR